MDERVGENKLAGGVTGGAAVLEACASVNRDQHSKWAHFVYLEVEVVGSFRAPQRPSKGRPVGSCSCDNLSRVEIIASGDLSR